ncbi:uncharacterized protein C19orf47-like [Pollicipes pollicipes]|uniref:uncharacterized protein C19orf47-like n=1 Tax=Pollicipes pollicipes TaxID=41117 RepID=UPI001884C028|nr:uncharacterized protein C19orf47-like [Pollicipes pollicipes]
MDADESSIKTWLKFFMDASIPAGVATEYAISFSDNRMRLDMLPDLNKDYLRDLNITILGDVIAILKHAKSVSQQEYTARKMGPGGRVSPDPPAARAKPAPACVESPAARMVKRLVRKEPASQPAEPTTRRKRAADLADDDHSAGDQPAPAKLRLVASGRLGTPQAKSALNGKKTVFDRLGADSQVTSTTPDSTRFHITGLSGPAATQRAPLHAEAAAVGTPRHRVRLVSEPRPGRDQAPA